MNSSMLNLSFRYDQTSARLEVEGLPDLSSDQGRGTIGILSTWRLQMVSAPQLEGKREHLEALMATVLPYARHHLSGVRRGFGDDSSSVQITPQGDCHRVVLRSSQPGINPLNVDLDDAELADLVRCLDNLRVDHRVQIPWTLPKDKPLPRREIVERVPIRQRLAAPLVGTSITVMAAVFSLMLPIPQTVDALQEASSSNQPPQPTSVKTEN